jgi:hypothetical protein
VFFLAAGDVRSQKKRVRLFLGFRVFLGFSKQLPFPCCDILVCYCMIVRYAFLLV